MSISRNKGPNNWKSNDKSFVCNMNEIMVSRLIKSNNSDSVICKVGLKDVHTSQVRSHTSNKKLRCGRSKI